LIDRGIYPDGYRKPNEGRLPKPENITVLREVLARPRPILSPSAFSETAFEDFQDSTVQVSEYQVAIRSSTGRRLRGSLIRSSEATCMLLG